LMILYLCFYIISAMTGTEIITVIFIIVEWTLIIWFRYYAIYFTNHILCCTDEKTEAGK
jgi:hypothetical protein